MKIVLNDKLVGFVLMGIFLASAFRMGDGGSIVDNEIVYPLWVKIVQGFSKYFLIIFVFISFLLIFFKKNIKYRLNLSILFLFIFNLYYISRQIYVFGFSVRLLFAFIISFFYLYLFSVFIPSFIKKDNYNILYKYLSITASIIIILNFILFLLDAASVSWQGRFYGLQAHPNFLAVISSISVVLFFDKLINYKLSNFEFSKIFEIVVHLIIILLSIFLIILTGSRTGILSCLFGVLTILFVNFQRFAKKIMFVLISIVIGLISFISYLFSSDEHDFRLDRSVSGDDTRSELWIHMWNTFLDNPIWGAGNGMGTANSYLRVLSDTGIIGFSLFLIVIIPIYLKIFNLGFLATFSKLKDYSLVNPSVPLALTLFFAAITEGFLLDFNSFSVLIFYLLLFFLGKRVVLEKF